MSTEERAAWTWRAPSNEEIAESLEEVASLLELQRANQYRVQAYRTAAQTIRQQPIPVAEVLEREGIDGLDRLPGIGESLARAVRELVTTGRLAMLERLRGESDPVAVLATLPGVGETLAHRLHDEHGIESLEDLEIAAHDGRLARIPGFGPKRFASVHDALAGRMPQGAREWFPDELPPVGEILDVDAEYRRRARAGTLVRIAPRRFNPTGESWLPVLHTARGERHYTALFSNTARAHALGRTQDWVVIYFDGRHGEHQCTVVTARTAPLAGRRVVRGREAECLAWYASAGGAGRTPTRHSSRRTAPRRR